MSEDNWNIHKLKLFNFAIIDIIGTIIIGILLYRYKIVRCSLQITIFGLFILGIIVHIIFNIPTRLNYLLGVSKDPVS